MIVGSTLVIPATAAAADPARHDFGQRLQGEVVQHEFTLENTGDEPARIARVQLTPPLSLGRLPALIPPHSHAALVVRLDTAKVHGDYEGQLLVHLEGGAEHSYSVAGKVRPPIEVVPMPAFFIATSKGTPKSASLEIVNREMEPLQLEIPPDPPYPLKLEALEPGRRFRLSVEVPADAAPGRSKHRLDLKTSSRFKPFLYIGMNSLVRERVYTVPDAVDFGLVRPGGPGDAQTLMVYQSAGKGFKVLAKSDIPGLDVKTEPGQQGDRVQLTLSMTPKATPGPLRGTIVLSTNDPEFPELRVPVTGALN